MNAADPASDATAAPALLAAVRAGDQTGFAELIERHRRELQVHCYRMMGSLEDSEDLVQETFLRAWRRRHGFEGRASVRTWLYRIATNACLDAIKADGRRARRPRSDGPTPAEVPWLQPYPDRLLEGVSPRDEEPDAVLVARETVELAFLSVIQQLPPRQRAALILRDVLGWSAKETASLLETSVASANSALQRARATVGNERPEQHAERAPEAGASDLERAVLERFMTAFEQADAAALAAVLHEDVRCTMPPAPIVFQGIEAVVGPVADGVLVPKFGDFRARATRANGLPAVALYLRPPGQTEYRPFALNVLRIREGRIVEMIGFSCPPHGPAFSDDPVPDLLPRFGLPTVL